MDLDQIKTILNGSGPESLDEWDKITRDTGMYTVALFAMSNSALGERLEPAGTGTLVTVGNSYYILTASHVWEEVLQYADRLGISLKQHVDHRFPIDIDKIFPHGPPRTTDWTMWGPDIVFLRIPLAHVGTIKATRVFYPLDAVDTAEPGTKVLETRLLMGTPAALGAVTSTHAQMQITGFLSSVVASHNHNGFDYLDVEVYMPAQGGAARLGGVSGGGLWRVLISSDPLTGKIDSNAILEGVAFFELPFGTDARTVRCHGPATIRVAMPPGKFESRRE